MFQKVKQNIRRRRKSASTRSNGRRAVVPAVLFFRTIAKTKKGAKIEQRPRKPRRKTEDLPSSPILWRNFIEKYEDVEGILCTWYPAAVPFCALLRPRLHTTTHTSTTQKRPTKGELSTRRSINRKQQAVPRLLCSWRLAVSMTPLYMCARGAVCRASVAGSC